MSKDELIGSFWYMLAAIILVFVVIYGSVSLFYWITGQF